MSITLPPPLVMYFLAQVHQPPLVNNNYVIRSTIGLPISIQSSYILQDADASENQL